jgi:hypothetical protein
MDVETESNFIGQEHRFWRIVYNFWTRTERFPDPKDPRRVACVRAFCWNLFFSPFTIATAGGLVSTFTLWLLWQQNQLLQENNSLVALTANPEQRYFVTIGDQLRILRTVNEGNENTIKNQPLGIGSVLFLDLNLSCSGNTPIVIEQFDVRMTFRDKDKEHTVRFAPHYVSDYRQVIRPGEIALIDARLIPLLRQDDEIHKWTIDELKSGGMSISISGRDVKGQVWRMKEQLLFSKDLLPPPSFRLLDLTTYDFLPLNKSQISDSISHRLDLPKGNPNRVIGTMGQVWGIKTENSENNRIVSRMLRQER